MRFALSHTRHCLGYALLLGSETRTPAPICAKPDPAVMLWPSTAENSARFSLKPGVLAFAMLSPITEIAVEAVSSPLTLLKRALVKDMFRSFHRARPKGGAPSS